MTCTSGDTSCETPRRRGALLSLALMALIFATLSVFSFTGPRKQVQPDTVSYGPYKAADGKRVFQAYNCMDCHTMVGNGGYLGPDLTREYAKAGPAWLAAFLPSAGSWPTDAVVRTQLRDAVVQAAAGVDSIEAYRQKFPGAGDRIERRAGKQTEMPNLPLTETEVGQLIAYLKYTSEMNTEGWPPKVEVDAPLDERVRLAHATGFAAAATPIAAPLVAVANTVATGNDDPAARGAQLVKEYGCTACHATTTQRLVGPGWGGLYDSHVELADGTSVKADEAYLVESILQPNAKVVKGYTPGVMPSFDGTLKPDEAAAIVAYLHTLEKP